MNYIKPFREVSLKDIPLVGGKNASLGQMIQDLSAQGVLVPDGFAITSEAYWHFLQENKLIDYINKLVEELDANNVLELEHVGKSIRERIVQAHMPNDLAQAISNAYQTLSKQYGQDECDVAVRSSATAEDLPEASFAGQQETYLAIKGKDHLLKAVKKCMASLFTDRALAYRACLQVDIKKIALSVGVQKMVRSDLAVSGVAFSIETESGFKGVVTISASYGLGELLVKGEIIPDEFYVHKDRLMHGFRPILQKKLGSKQSKLVYDTGLPGRTKKVSVSEKQQESFCLNDDQILAVAKTTIIIENHYSQLNGHYTPVDIEWAIDGNDGKLYVVQARPETIHSRQDHSPFFYRLDAKEKKLLTTGTAIGQKIASGTARVISRIDESRHFNEGDILVTEMTDPDWVPLLKKASAVVTNSGGRTCHVAIVSRELGIPAVIATRNATTMIHDGDTVTVDCSQGIEGFVYEGTLPFSKEKLEIKPVALPASIMINCGDPHKAFGLSCLPVLGVGLARLEFIIASLIKVHPMAIMQPETIDGETRKKIQELSRGYDNPREFYKEVLASAVGMIAGAFYPRQVVVRLTDFKTNEYRGLLGGAFFEPVEENPMLGFRGAARYTSAHYASAFELECAALKHAREIMGFDNICIMVPFVRTVDEAKRTIDTLKNHGIHQGKNGITLFMMVEIPSNCLLMDEFCELFDGFSIGSNDLTQLTLGVDRDSGILAPLFDERDPAVKKLMFQAIKVARGFNKPIGICGQAPSDFPELARELMDAGITSLSLNVDALSMFFNFFAKPD